MEEVARQNARRSGGTFTKTRLMAEAFAGADIVYPKSWGALCPPEKRTELYAGATARASRRWRRSCWSRMPGTRTGATES